MSERLDVRKMLVRRGWDEGSDQCLRKNGALWVAINSSGDSGLDGPNQTYSVTFNADVPARIIVATCEAAAGVTR
jgi:hypothetical protein